MDERAIIGELRDIIVKRLRFDPARLTGLTAETPLPRAAFDSMPDRLATSQSAVFSGSRLGAMIGNGDSGPNFFSMSRVFSAHDARERGCPCGCVMRSSKTWQPVQSMMNCRLTESSGIVLRKRELGRVESEARDGDSRTTTPAPTDFAGSAI